MHRGERLRWEQIDQDYLEKEIRPLKILVIGCGGGGCNSIHRLSSIGLEGAETIAINTDKRHLQAISADKRLLIGAAITRGLGAGGNPERGRQCAYSATDILNHLLLDADLTFILVGMGGGTGTGAAPVVAEAAKRNGSLVISIVTTPFEFERARMEVAMEGLREVDYYSDTILMLDNNKLLELVPNLPVADAFAVMDMLISEIVRGLIEVITKPSLINLDFADLCSVLSQGGISTLMYGEGSDPEGVVTNAFSNPLLDIDMTGATGALIHITGGSNLTLKRVDKIVRGITEQLDPDAQLICGARVDEQFEGQIRVMAVITGIAEINEEDDIEVDGEIKKALVRYGP